MSTIVEVAAAPATSVIPRLKVKDLKAGAFSRLKAEFSNHADAIEIMNYIEFLAQNNSTSADELELPYPAEEKLKKWELTRAEATALFFGHIEAKNEELRKSVVLPSDDAQKAIIAAMKSREAQAKASITARLATHTLNAADYNRRANSELALARNLNEQLELMDGSGASETRMTKIMDALASTNWNFHRINGTKLEFISRTEVMLRHIEPKAGMHYELNCGKFKVSIDLNGMYVNLQRHERCAVGGHWHPHVDSQGTICFGNGAATYNQAVVNGDVLAILQLIDKLLPNYGDQPYVTINNFKKGIDERDRLEREAYGKAKGQKTTQAGTADDQEILDDEPAFDDNLEWTGEPNE